MRYQGRITQWRDEQGYGFITPNGSGERVFLHIKSFLPRSHRPSGNELVKFVKVTDEKGRPRAEQVEYVAQTRHPAKSARHASTFALLFAGSFLVVVGVIAIVGKIPAVVFFAYVVASVLTFWLYASDKSAAREGRWRVKESTLQLFALLGGWPGGLAAQQLLRHKSRKLEFLLVFWFAVAANIGVLGWLLSANGAQFLQRALGT